MKLLAPNTQVTVAGVDGEGFVSQIILALDTNDEASVQYSIVDDSGAQIAIVFREDLSVVSPTKPWHLETHS